MNMESEPICKSDRMQITATEKTDFFNFWDAKENKVQKKANAPLAYTEVTGDFIATVQLSAIFRDTYDSAVLMLWQDIDTWAKACLELTDFGKIAVVSVVTNKLSDDANGNNLNVNSVHIKAVRVNNDFSFHYSLDGVTYEMMRFFHLDMEKTIRLGFAAQSPVGQGTECVFDHFTLCHHTAQNIREGV